VSFANLDLVILSHFSFLPKSLESQGGFHSETSLSLFFFVLKLVKKSRMSHWLEGVSYPLIIEGNKKRKKEGPKLVAIEAQFERDQERKGCLDEKGRLTLPVGESHFSVFETSAEECQDACALLFDGKGFVLRPISRKIIVKREIEGKNKKPLFGFVADC
jgi:hypothetical protein